MDDLEVGEVRRVAPGVSIARRTFAVTVLGLMASVLPSSVQRARARTLARASLTFEEFLAEAKPLASELVGDNSLVGQSRYLLSMAALATRLTDVPVPEMKDTRQGETAGTFIGFNPGGDPFTVLHWRLEPGARVRPHAHTYGNVVTLGLAGEAYVENFEVVGERDFTSSAEFEVRRTQAQRLTAGAVNLVNLQRDYIHGTAAGPAGARGLDITTRLAPRTPTPYLMIPARADRTGVFRATWSMDDPRPGAML